MVTVAAMILPSTAAAVSFDGEFVLGAPLHAVGKIGTENGSRSLFLMQPGQESFPDMGHVLDASNARVLVHTERRGPTPPVPGRPGQWLDALGVTSQSDDEVFEARQLRVELIALDASSNWTIDTTSDLNHSHAQMKSSCDIVPRGLNFSKPVQIERHESVGWPGASPSLRGRCSSTNLTVANWTRVQFFGSSFRLSDDEGVREFRTGTWDERDDEGPGLVSQKVRRAITIDRIQGDASFTFGPRTNVELESPRLAIAGAVQLPNGTTGHIAWDDWRFLGPTGALHVAGAFLVSSPGPMKLAIQGEAFDAPPMASTSKTLGVPIGVIASAALVVVGAAYALGWILRRPLLGLLGLFSRIARGQGLDHKMRGEIADIVRENPGIGVTDVARMLGIHYSTARYHAFLLCKKGILLCRKFRNQTSLFLPDVVSFPRQAHAFATRRDIVRRLLVEIEAEPEASQRCLASRLGVTRQYVAKLLGELEAIGLVSTQVRGRTRRRVETRTE